jgi:hypothetical protein
VSGGRLVVVVPVARVAVASGKKSMYFMKDYHTICTTLVGLA